MCYWLDSMRPRAAAKQLHNTIFNDGHTRVASQPKQQPTEPACMQHCAWKEGSHLLCCKAGSDASSRVASSSVMPSANSNSTTGSGSKVAKLRTTAAPHDVQASCGDSSGMAALHRQQLCKNCSLFVAGRARTFTLSMSQRACHAPGTCAELLETEHCPLFACSTSSQANLPGWTRLALFTKVKIER